MLADIIVITGITLTVIFIVAFIDCWLEDKYGK